MQRSTKFRIGISLVELAASVGIFYATYNPALSQIDFAKTRYKTIEEKTASGEIVSELYCSVSQKNGVITHFRINPDGKIGTSLEVIKETMNYKALQAKEMKREAAITDYNATVDREKNNINQLEKLADEAKNAWGWSTKSLSSPSAIPRYDPAVKKTSSSKTMYDLEKDLDKELKKEKAIEPTPLSVPPRVDEGELPAPVIPENLKFVAPGDKLVPITGWRKQ